MKPVVEIWPSGVTFECPGCGMLHQARIAGPSVEHPCWTFNGDLEKPTLSPSLLVRWGRTGEPPQVCHSFVKEGQIQFLGDCTHDKAGQTVPLLVLEEPL